MNDIKYLDLNGLKIYNERIQNWVTDEISESQKNYLPLSGGTMSGDIDMGGNEIKNTNFELVESLQTENLYEGRQVTYEGKIYTYHNEKWLNVADDLGGKPETHEENFVYQPTASDLSIKDGFADIKKLKGNTVVWNQLNGSVVSYNNYGITQIQNNDGTFTLDGTATQKFEIYNVGTIYNPLPIGHKGLFELKHISGDIIGDLKFSYGQIQLGTNIKVIKTDSTNYRYLLEIISEGCVLNKATFSFQCFDLTQMFGEGNEPATVEEFEAMFPNSYYEYNEGELLSFDGMGLKSVGFNQWDEEWELGAYEISNGNKVQQDTHLRNVNPIKVLGDTDYYFKSSTTLFLCWYDSEMNFIVPDGANHSVNNSIIKSPSNATYLNFYQYNKNTYDNDICINLSHSGYRNGDYEPYKDHTLSFQEGKTISQLTGKLNGEGESVTIFPDGLRSAGEAFDEIVYDESTGKHKAIKRIGRIDMGTLYWSYAPESEVFYNDQVNGNFDYSSHVKKANIITPKYPTVSSYTNNYSISAAKFTYNGSIIKRVWINDSSYTDSASLKASLQGQILYYELAEPEVYELDFPINTSYEAYDFGTEEVLYNDGNEVNIPMKASIEYGFNAVDMIRGNYFNLHEIKKDVDNINTSIENKVDKETFENRFEYLHHESLLPENRNSWTAYLVGDDLEELYLTIEALEDDLTVSFSMNTIQYTIDDGDTWNELPVGAATPAINAGDKISFKANSQPQGPNPDNPEPVAYTMDTTSVNTTNLTSGLEGGIGTFTVNKKFNLKGNVMSMLFEDEGKNSFDLTGYDFAFMGLFNNCTKLQSVSKDFLPATTLSMGCYFNMFAGCTSLVTAPELPATTLTEGCYSNMFYGCTSLVTAPSILPATTLVSGCYYAMFYGCSSLVTAPELPATTLTMGCYQYMFNYCTSLNYIKALFTTEPSSYTDNWVNGVSSTGTFIKNANATWNVTGVDGIPEGWTVETTTI